MKTKSMNDQKYNDYRKNKMIKWLIIILSLLVIALEVLALLEKINMIWGFLVFGIIYLLKKI